MNKGQPIIIDCDTGRDDALTIWAAIRRDMNVVTIVASYGNVARDAVADNTARVMSLGGADGMPLLLGADGPSRDHAGFQNIVAPRQRKSGNGLCNLDLPAATVTLSDTVTPETLTDITARHGKIHYVVLGPATGLANLARAMGPAIHDHIGRVTMMGGKTGALWDTMPGADFNMICDPFAVRDMIDAGMNPRFVTLNTTWDIWLDLPALEALRPRDTLAQWAKDLMIAHVKGFSPDPVFRFHDPAALLAAMDDGGFHPVTLHICCDDRSPDFGRITPAEGVPNAAIYEADDGTRTRMKKDILSALGLNTGNGNKDTFI